MPAQRKQPDVFELINGFADQLEQQEYRPNINRYEPLPEQDLFHQRQTKGGILFGGNRGGKTHGGIADDVMILTRKHPHRNHLYPAVGQPLRMRFIGTDFPTVEEVAVPLFAQMIPSSFLINGSWEDSYRKGDHVLTLADKSFVRFMSYEQDPNKFQAASIHHIHFDEEPPKPIFDESMLRLIDTRGSWTLSETPVQQMEWVQDELIVPHEDGKRPDISIFYLDTRKNKFLPPEELLLLENNLSEEEKVVRLAGQYPDGGKVFPEFNEKSHVIPAGGFVLTPQHRVYRSMDHGYANPTAWLWTAVDLEGNITTFRSLYAPRIVVGDWAESVHAVDREIAELLGVPGWQPYATFGDPGIAQRNNGVTGTTVQQEYALRGIYIGIEGIVKTRTGNANVGLNKMHTYLRPRSKEPDSKPWWQITDNNPALISEMRRARKPKQTLKAAMDKNTSEEIRDKDNHAIDAFKYLVMATHELRPEEYIDQDDQIRAFHDMMNVNYEPTRMSDDYAFEHHSSNFVATIASGWTHGLEQGLGDYDTLE